MPWKNYQTREPVQTSFRVYDFNNYLYGFSLAFTILIMIGLWLYTIKEKNTINYVSLKFYHRKSTGVFRNLSVEKSNSSTSLLRQRSQVPLQSVKEQDESLSNPFNTDKSHKQLLLRVSLSFMHTETNNRNQNKK